MKKRILSENTKNWLYATAAFTLFACAEFIADLGTGAL
jgi:hypothetical protein